MNLTSIFTVLVIFASFPSQAEIPEAEDAILVTTTFGAVAGKWSVEHHPRFMADVNDDGRDDIVGFGGEGVFVALSTSTADAPSFAKHSMVLEDFAYSAGGWRAEKNPRLMADVNNDGRADIVGFGNRGVYVSLSTATEDAASFSKVTKVQDVYGYDAGSWRVAEHLRFMADVNNDGRADIVAFGNHSVYVSLSTSTGEEASFAAHQAVISEDFTPKKGYRSIRNYPRMVADVNNDGRSDIIGFAADGVYVSLSTSTAESASFAAPELVMPGFGTGAGKWRTHQHPRFVEDVNGDGRADIVAIGDDGVFVALSASTANQPVFEAPVHVLSNFGRLAGGWVVGKNPRFVEDVNGDGRKDIVGFGNKGVVISLSSSTASAPAFREPQTILQNMAHDAGSWRVDKHPRMVADVNGDGAGDLTGFGGDGAIVFLTGTRWDELSAVVAAAPATQELLTNGKDARWPPVSFAVIQWQDSEPRFTELTAAVIERTHREITEAHPDNHPLREEYRGAFESLFRNSKIEATEAYGVDLVFALQLQSSSRQTVLRLQLYDGRNNSTVPESYVLDQRGGLTINEDAIRLLVRDFRFTIRDVQNYYVGRAATKRIEAVEMVAAASQDSFVGRTAIRGRGGIVYEVGTETPFTGTVVEPVDDGVIEVIRFADGRRHGLAERYYEFPDRPRRRWNYEQGRIDGQLQHWSPYGSLQLQMQFADGVEAGVRTEWHHNGQLSSRTFFEDGEQLGKSYHWSGDGSFSHCESPSGENLRDCAGLERIGSAEHAELSGSDFAATAIAD